MVRKPSRSVIMAQVYVHEENKNSSPRSGTSVVIITDSRGRGLQSIFDKLDDKIYKVRVLVWIGRGITEAVKESKSQLLWIAPDLIILLSGI